MAVKRRRVTRRRNPNPNPRVRAHFRRTPARRRRRNPNPNPNPRRRRRVSYRRATTKRRRRNPPSMRRVGTHLMPQLGWATAGFMSTRIVGNMITPLLGGLTMGQPLVRMGTKLGVAYLAAWMLEFVGGRHVFTPAFIGGSIEVIQDFAKTFIAPMIPALGAYQEPLEVYYERPAAAENGNNGIGVYYQPEVIPETVP